LRSATSRPLAPTTRSGRRVSRHAATRRAIVHAVERVTLRDDLAQRGQFGVYPAGWLITEYGDPSDALDRSGPRPGRPSRTVPAVPPSTVLTDDCCPARACCFEPDVTTTAAGDDGASHDGRCGKRPGLPPHLWAPAAAAQGAALLHRGVEIGPYRCSLRRTGFGSCRRGAGQPAGLENRFTPLARHALRELERRRLLLGAARGTLETPLALGSYTRRGPA